VADIFGNLPSWELDELRRIIRNGGLSAMDDERTIELLRQCFGGNFVDPEVETILPGMDDYSRMCDIGSNVLLTGLEIGAGCGALCSGTFLPIDGRTGIQFYLGPNGSGKSSYVRVFRAIGRSRTKSTLLSNIYGGGLGSSAATAGVNVKCEEYSDCIRWRGDSSNNRLLASISVFDAECGGVYLESGSVAEAAPSALEVFQSLVDARRRIKDKLQDRFVQNEREIDGLLPPGVYIWAIGMLARKGVKDPFAHISWTQENENRLAELRCAKERYEAILSDIEGHLEKMSSAKASVAASCKLVSDINQVVTLLATATGNAVSDAIESLSEGNAERNRFLLSADGIEKTLNGVEVRAAVGIFKEIIGRINQSGIDPYRKESLAHFPVTLDHRCAVCDQGLSPESLERLRIFDEMIHEAATASPGGKDLSKWQATVDMAIEHSREIKYFLKNILVGSPIDGLPESAQGLLDLLDDYIESLLSRVYISSSAEEIVIRVSELRTGLGIRLLHYERLESELRALSHVNGGYFDDSGLNELVAMLWVSNNRDIAAQLYRLYDENQWISVAKSDLGISEITSLSKKLAAELVGDGLAEHMSYELQKFGLGDIRVQISTSSRIFSHNEDLCEIKLVVGRIIYFCINSMDGVVGIS
jgi:hypothetical protein